MRTDEELNELLRRQSLIVADLGSQLDTLRKRHAKLVEAAFAVVKDTDNWRVVSPQNPQIAQDIELLRQALRELESEGGSLETCSSSTRKRGKR